MEKRFRHICKFSIRLVLTVVLFNLSANLAWAANPQRCGIGKSIFQFGKNGTEQNAGQYFRLPATIRRLRWLRFGDEAPELIQEKLCRPFLDAGKSCKTDKLEIKALLITEFNGKKRVVYLKDAVFESNNPEALIGGSRNISNTSVIATQIKARRCSS